MGRGKLRTTHPDERERASIVADPAGARAADGALGTHPTFGESMKMQGRNVVRFRLGMAMLAANRGEPSEVLNQSSTFLR